MNQELKNITSWLSCNKLSLNVKKTHYMLCKAKRKKLDQTFEIKINDQQIDKVNYRNLLGLYIDDELSWRKHIDQISTKISKMTEIMTKTRHVLSIQTLQTICNTMVYPYLKPRPNDPNMPT